MKIKIDNYTFNKTAKTVTFTDYATIRLDGLLLITNATDGVIIFNFADTAKGGTVTGNVLTLTFDTSSMDNGDKLLIYYDDTTDEVALASNQDSIQSLIETLQELIQRLAPLASVIANTAALRITPIASVTVSGPITSAQSIAEKNVAGVSYTQRVAAENLTVIQSNIQNIIAK
jgi:hypothetical protein